MSNYLMRKNTAQLNEIDRVFRDLWIDEARRWLLNSTGKLTIHRDMCLKQPSSLCADYSTPVDNWLLEEEQLRKEGKLDV
jgi:hypothetical protein